MTTLVSGGHIADFRLEESADAASVSPLWVPPWRTIEPDHYRESDHRSKYGTITEGKLLSGLAGHCICLDYFGLPSAEEAKQGLSLHGEAPSSKWRSSGISLNRQRVSLAMSVRLPVAGLRFSRTIELRKGESVAHFKEVVRNERKADHFFHWAQHVTLGLPFLSPDEAVTTMPGAMGITYPHGYDEGKGLLASNRVFRWPTAPLVEGEVDLTRPFLRDGLGFVVAVLLDKKKALGFVAAVNGKLGLLVAYCFKRSDFPWVAIWEENLAMAAPPWKLRTRARGLEFSTTPLPVLRREAFLSGGLFGESTLTYVPALDEKAIHYVALLAKIPNGFGSVKDIELAQSQIAIWGSSQKKAITIKASGIEKLLH
jgi:hypothetical protein